MGMTENCALCRFYHNKRCRRFPPTVWGDGLHLQAWPRLEEANWCGEWKDKP